MSSKISILIFLILNLNILFIHSFEYSFPPNNRVGDELKCKDESVNSVDWFIAYKLPKIEKSPDSNFKRGAGYYYFTAGDNSWRKSSLGSDHPDSLFGKNTISLYTNDSNLAYVLYNDQPPNRPVMMSNGHTKGMILTTHNKGIWLAHSLPHFPIPGPEYSYPRTGYTNGQTFLCMSMNISQIDGIGDILRITKPNVFSYQIPDSFQQSLPTLLEIVKHGRIRKKEINYKIFHINAANLFFTVFTKPPKFHSEMYSEVVANILKTSLKVQSWLNGLHPFQSNCTSPNYPVYNNLINDVSGDNFSTHSDHSKWAVGIAKSWTCIGDLNRMEHQLYRGGAIICTAERKIWNIFKNTVEEISNCPKK